MDGYAVGAAVERLPRLAREKMRAVAFEAGCRDIWRVADDHVDGALEAFSGEGGEQVALPDDDAVAKRKAIDVAPRKRDRAVGEVGTPDTRKRYLLGDPQSEIAGSAAHVDHGRRSGALGQDRCGVPPKEFRLLPRHEHVRCEFEVDAHESYEPRHATLGPAVKMIVALQHEGSFGYRIGCRPAHTSACR